MSSFGATRDNHSGQKLQKDTTLNVLSDVFRGCLTLRLSNTVKLSPNNLPVINQTGKCQNALHFGASILHIWQWVQRIQIQIYNLASKIRVTNICCIYKICCILDCAPDLRCWEENVNFMGHLDYIWARPAAINSPWAHAALCCLVFY